MALTYIQQNGSTGQTIKYANKYYPYATIATSGCGVCSTLMVILNSTSYSPSLSTWATALINGGARNGDGTNMTVAANIMKNKYGFTCKVTSDISELKSHLKKGYKAVINVGGKGYFSSDGHFVCAAGITTSDKAIILDPYYYSNKWTSTVNGINRSNHFTYNSSTHEVYCSFSTIEADAKGSRYFLFTPSKSIKVKYSAKDAITAAPKAPTVKNGTYNLTNVRGIYNGCGADTGRKKVKNLSVDGQKNATSTNKNADAYLKAGTAVTITETKLASSGNLWAKIPSGWLCVWEKDKNKKFIK